MTEQDVMEEYLKNRKISDEERQYLASYDISQFDQPSVTVDIAVFAVRADEDCDRKQDYRKDPPLELSLLMIRRGGYPFKDEWALPGGFARPGESLEDCAERELYEETSVKHAYLQPFAAYSDSGRDPRGWIISNGFLALVDAKDYRIRASTDAWDAKWFTVRLEEKEIRRKVEGTHAEICTHYRLELKNAERNIQLTSELEEERSFEQHHESTVIRILSSEGIAFDHAKIILQAFARLRRLTEYDGKIVFDLMPEKFTLYQLQEAHEIILGRKLLTPNFRRKIAPYVKETDQSVSGAGHRPAKLFRRNLEAFYSSSQDTRDFRHERNA